MGKVFATVSGKGGVGKSTFCVWLAFAFARKNKKVLLVDMDEGLRCLDLMLGVDKTAVFDLSDVLNDKAIEDATYTSPLNANISVIPAPQSVGLVHTKAFADFAETVKEMFDIVLFDFPAGINLELYSALPKSTVFLTIAVPDPISVRDAAAVSDVLYGANLKVRLIINRFIYKQKRRLRYKNIDGIIDAAGVRLLGIVPESDEMRLFSLRQKISFRKRPFKAFVRIADRLLGEKVLLPRLNKI